MVRGRAEQGSVDSFELKLISEKDSHVIGSDTGKHRRFETQPRGAYRNVTRAPSQVAAETLSMLQRTVYLVCIKIDRNPPHADQVYFSFGLNHFFVIRLLKINPNKV